MIFKTKNGDTIECTPSEFLELAAAISTAKEEDNTTDYEFNGYCSIKGRCCDLCKEHDDNCTNCPANSYSGCYYDKSEEEPIDDWHNELVEEFKNHPNYAEKPTKVSVENACPHTGQYCEQCARHNGKCLDCSGCLEYKGCPVMKMIKGEDEEDVEEEAEEEEFIFNDIFINHPETSEGTKLINDYVFGKFKDNYFYHPDIIVTCADDDSIYRDLYIARDKEGYGVLFKDTEAFIKAMHDNNLQFCYIRVYHDDHDEEMLRRLIVDQFKVITERAAKYLTED